MDQSQAPLLDALVDYHRSNRDGFSPPGHRQGAGVDDRVLASALNDAVIDYLRSGVDAGMNLPDPADPSAQKFRVVA
jgi:arginine/lysine/ornithine decarboxylase